MKKGLIAALLASVACLSAARAEGVPRIAVTDLAYTQAVAQYFEVADIKSKSALSANRNGFAASGQTEATYVSGTYSYIEQRELGGFTNDIKGALLKGTSFKLVQGKGFDEGAPQPTKAEQVLNQVKTGKMAKPVRQPEVKDIIDRIRKGEFKGADYVLFGTLSSIEFRDQLSPLQGTSSASYQFSLDLLADFSLINTRTYEIKAAFSAQGSGNETKLLSNRGDVIVPNRAKVMRETSQSLAANVYEQLVAQLESSDPNMARKIKPSSISGPSERATTTTMPVPQSSEPMTVFR
jgi:curli biogenesis system outer membrane secretion channel CsgG